MKHVDWWFVGMLLVAVTLTIALLEIAMKIARLEGRMEAISEMKAR